MSELLKIVLSLSLSGTLLFFIILALKPLYKNTLSKRWQYYIWLIVIARMLLPFTPEATLVGSACKYLGNIHVETFQMTPPIHDTPLDFGSDDRYISQNGQPQAPQSNIDSEPSIPIQAIYSKLYENLWILWAAIAFALLIRKITMYQSFVRFVKAGRAEVSDIEVLNTLADTGEMVGVKKPVELFINPLISSPMLLGFFYPCIILPGIDMDRTELAYIMRHELTHYKNLDMFYKWLVQIIVCLHWFNPFAYLLAKEINKCCELSCDEAIIRTLDNAEKKAYGDTLLNSLKTTGHYNDNLATVTLTEGAERLKERLDAIMQFKKASKITVISMFVITLVLAAGAAAIGAYAATPTPADNNNHTNVNGTAKSVSALQDVTADSAKSISITATSCGIELVKSENSKFTFDYLGVENPSKFKVSANSNGDALEIVVDGTSARTVGGHYYVGEGATPVNVVRIGIPDRAYQTLTMELMEAPISLPDFKAAISINSEDGTISISDQDISKGSYNINNASGGVSITANTVLSSISIKNQGECDLTFNQMPQNLTLDLSACQGQIVLPDGWTKTQTFGNGTPTIKINNQGYTEVRVIEAEAHSVSSSGILPDHAKGLAISFDIDNGGVELLPAASNEIKASYDSEYYNVDFADKNGKWNITISGKVAMMGKTSDVQLYVPSVTCTMDVNVLNGNFSYALPEDCADKISITARNAGIDFSSNNQYKNCAISLVATDKDFIEYEPPIYPNYFTKTSKGFEYIHGTGANRIDIKLTGYTSVAFNE